MLRKLQILPHIIIENFVGSLKIQIMTLNFMIAFFHVYKKLNRLFTKPSINDYYTFWYLINMI